MYGVIVNYVNHDLICDKEKKFVRLQSFRASSLQLSPNVIIFVGGLDITFSYSHLLFFSLEMFLAKPLRASSARTGLLSLSRRRCISTLSTNPHIVSTGRWNSIP